MGSIMSKNDEEFTMVSSRSLDRSSGDFEFIPDDKPPKIPDAYDLDTKTGLQDLERYLLYATAMVKHLSWTRSRIDERPDWKTEDRDGTVTWRRSELYGRVSVIMQDLLRLKKEFNLTYYEPPSKERELVDPRSAGFYGQDHDYISDEYYISEKLQAIIEKDSKKESIVTDDNPSKLEYMQSRWYYENGDYLQAAHTALNHFDFRAFAILDKHNGFSNWTPWVPEDSSWVPIERHDGTVIQPLSMEEIEEFWEPQDCDQNIPDVM